MSDLSNPDTLPEPDPVDIVIEDERWLDVDLQGMAERAAAAATRHLGIDTVEIVVMGCDDTRIAALNDHFRGKAKPTNVLSWPSVEPAPRAPGEVPVPPDTDELGDIAISFFLTLFADALGRKAILVLGAALMTAAGVAFALSGNFWVMLAAAIVGIISPR